MKRRDFLVGLSALGSATALTGSSAGAIPFLMYPNGETVEGRLNSLYPTTFRYEIHSREHSA